MVHYNVLAEIDIPQYHHEDMWGICKEAINSLNPRIREKRSTYIFVGESEDGEKTVTLTLVDKKYGFEGFYTTRYGFASDDDPARKAGEECAACGIKKMQMYAL